MGMLSLPPQRSVGWIMFCGAVIRHIVRAIGLNSIAWTPGRLPGARNVVAGSGAAFLPRLQSIRDRTAPAVEKHRAGRRGLLVLLRSRVISSRSRVVSGRALRSCERL